MFNFLKSIFIGGSETTLVIQTSVLLNVDFLNRKTYPNNVGLALGIVNINHLFSFLVQDTQYSHFERSILRTTGFFY